MGKTKPPALLPGWTSGLLADRKAMYFLGGLLATVLGWASTYALNWCTETRSMIEHTNAATKARSDLGDSHWQQYLLTQKSTDAAVMAIGKRLETMDNRLFDIARAVGAPTRVSSSGPSPQPTVAQGMGDSVFRQERSPIPFSLSN